MSQITSLQPRPAAFLDRDGVINVDYGHVGTIDRLDFVPGAAEAIRLLNDSGYYVFVVTNQAGIAKGKYSEDQYRKFMAHLISLLADSGAVLDDTRYCPFHADATVEKYRVADHPWRKPNPGMLLDLMEHWPVNREASFLVGDKESDIEAARRASVRGFLFEGGNLLDFMRKII